MNLPFDERSELGVIGCCLLGGSDTANEAIELVTSSVFSRPDCLEAWQVIAGLVEAGAAVDSVTFWQAWRARFGEKPVPEAISGAAEAVPSVHQLSDYAAALNDCRDRREAATALHSAAYSAVNAQVPIVDTLAGLEKALDARGGSTIPKVHSGFDVSKLLIDDLERRYKLNGALSGIPTGFTEWDKLTDGLQYGEQTLIAARPSAGKTALAMNVAEYACLKCSFPTLFVSLEMSEVALHRRLTSSFCKIPMWELKRGTVGQESSDEINAFNMMMKKVPLFYLDAVAGIDVNRLCAAVRRHVRKHGIKLVIIDYLQKIRPAQRQEKKTYEVGDVSGAVRALAVSTGAAFLTLAQLNRESDKDKGRLPRLSDLGDSKQIEQDADGVAMIHRPRSDHDGKQIPGDQAVLIVNKQRDGETGTLELNFDGRYCRFENP